MKKQTNKDLKMVSVPSEFAKYVGFYSGEYIPSGKPISAMFYTRDGSYLVVLSQENGEVVEMITPKYEVSLFNPVGKFKNVLEEGFKQDGKYLVDTRTGNILLRYEDKVGATEIDWEFFEDVPSLIHDKLMCLIWSEEQSARPVLLFPETYAPSMLYWVNRMYLYNAPPDGEPTELGLSIITAHELDREKLPRLNRTLIKNNLDTLCPTGKPRLTKRNTSEFEDMLVFLGDMIEDAEKESAYEKLERMTKDISAKELQKLLQDKSFNLANTEYRYKIKASKLESRNLMAVLTFGKLFVHLQKADMVEPTRKMIRRLLSFPKRIPIEFLPLKMEKPEETKED